MVRRRPTSQPATPRRAAAPKSRERSPDAGSGTLGNTKRRAAIRPAVADPLRPRPCRPARLRPRRASGPTLISDTHRCSARVFRVARARAQPPAARAGRGDGGRDEVDLGRCVVAPCQRQSPAGAPSTRIPRRSRRSRASIMRGEREFFVALADPQRAREMDGVERSERRGERLAARSSTEWSSRTRSNTQVIEHGSAPYRDRAIRRSS